MSRKLSVLVIEDSRLIQQTIKALLIKSGYDVIEADDGETGLALAISTHPDVVLVDVLLPGALDGLAVCHEIRSTPGLEETPILILSSLKQEADFAAGRLYGADDYLIKPVDKVNLLARIDSVLKARGVTA
jgi:DNA-binding response OmpR family regulator